MIHINLLPTHLRPQKRSPLPHILSVLLLCFVVVALFIMATSHLAAKAELRRELDRTTEDLAALADVVEEFNELSAKKQMLSSRITIIQEILQDRIIWSRQLHRLSELTPENIWYSRIRETHQTVREDVVKMDEETNEPVIDEDTGEPVYERQNVRRSILEISGYVINDSQGQNQISPLTQQLANDPDFSRMFRIIRPRIEDTEFEGYQVRGFTLEYMLDPEDAEV